MNENQTEIEIRPEESETAETSAETVPAKTAEPVPESGTKETATAGEPAQKEEEEPSDDVYRRQAEEDLLELRRIDPDAANYRHLGEMPGALRFAELRGLGLSVEEAYYAVRGALGAKPSLDRGGRAHLHASVPGRAASGGVGMTVGEIENARRLFPGLPDREIASLWRRVNEN